MYHPHPTAEIVKRKNPRKWCTAPNEWRKGGQISHETPQSFCLLFERSPVWLLSLNSGNTAYIYLLNCDSFVDFNAHLDGHKINNSLYHSVISSLGRKRFVFSPPPEEVIYLVSGSLPFLNEQSRLIVNKKRDIYY